MSETMMPSVRLSREAKWRACTSGKYPRRLTAESTRLCVRGPTFPVLFNTLETVAVDTPAALATSRMVRPISRKSQVPELDSMKIPDWAASGLQYRLKKMLDNIERLVR